MAAYDYVIVGGGPAGCVLASRLSADPAVRVLLLEAGPEDKDPYIHWPAGFYKLTGSTKNGWGYETAPLAHVDGRRMWFPQGRVLGGGGSINAQVFTRGNPMDYDEWAEAEGCAGWAFADVLPYFRRFEDNERFSNAWHGTGGPIGVSDPITPHPMSKAFVRAAQEAGLPYNPDFNGERQEGCGLYQVTQRRGRRSSAAVAYLRPAMARPNLSVRTRAIATRILIERGRAVGIEYVEGGAPTRHTARAEAEVLVTAGAIGSPKLLLLSGIGPADELRALGIEVVHDLPGVGRNLQDHIDVYVISELCGPHSYNKHTRLHRQLWAGLQYYTFGCGPVTSNLAEAGGFWYADPKARSPDIQFHFLPGSGLEAGVTQLCEHGCTLNSAFLRPQSRGTVRLAGTDPFAHPLIDPNYLAEEYDRRISIGGLRLAREIMAQPAFRPYLRAERLPGPEVRSDAEVLAYARQHGKTDYHPVGTCKMGVDEMAVVDLELKARGLERLRVCDSSVMPRLVSSNTNAPTLMIGEKAAELVKGAFEQEAMASKEFHATT
ncbi:MAG: GMC family oxidoreductase [Geminicoccaceae bacterium]